MGSCTPVAQPDAGTSGSGGGGGFTILGTAGQGGGAGGNGGSTVTVGTGGQNGTAGGGGTVPQRGNISNCACDTARGPGAGGVALLLAGLAIAAGRRRAAARVRRK